MATPRLRPIVELGAELGLAPADLEPYGRDVAKIGWEAIARARARPRGSLVLVTAVTPTAEGEGKTTIAIGLVDALRRLGVRAVATLRQPSLGPVFGRKGCGSGGGRAQVVPAERMNLHLTGDFHAVTAAHDLLAALVDNHLNHGNALGLEPGSIVWPRALDVNDRALRDVVVGLGGRANGPVRETAFVITAASEVMAVLALAGDVGDLRGRLGRIVVGRRKDGSPATAEDLHATGAMAALLVDAMKPNVLQTLEGTPVLVHAGPYGNVSQGASSVVADRVALGLAEVVVTEAGFGADLGAEKFFDLKCRQSGLWPAAAVLVATVRALKRHGTSTRAPDEEDVAAVRRGAENLARHLDILRAFEVPVVVAVNVHATDTAAELDAVCEAAKAEGAAAAVAARPYAEGGAGAVDLARAVTVTVAAREREQPVLLYPDALPLAAKIEAIATRVYGAAAVEYSHAAMTQMDDAERLGFGRLPVCVAKTHLSLSHDPLLGPSPRGFRFPVRELRTNAGAGFVTAVAGDTQLMPGLPARTRAESIDVDADGRIVGL
ncbi:formate--tetrahydrofolate ligase [Anaeromyxobacter terrae]|uniref:formate--tetrahydrofolate ligase n=1 Tax=Anaeromyxobacter terrae TaxID=2925406 RepID=UPI001F59C8EC|nr:formate--tetrahydrofolate ligase [Anaeromyxobacter sp. SG22]